MCEIYFCSHLYMFLGGGSLMAVKIKYQIGDSVRSKVAMEMRLEVIGIVNHPKFVSYRCLDTYGAIHEIHDSMLLKW